MINNERESNDWHLDKRVPVSIIGVFFIQTVTFVYLGTAWKADTDNRITNLERAGSHIAHVDDAINSQDHRLTVLETKLEDLGNTLVRIENGVAILTNIVKGKP